MRRLVFTLSLTVTAVAVAAFVLISVPTQAHEVPCDFLTGGGFIIRDSGAKANFGVGGGCKHGSPTWGHLQYNDHGTGLKVHGTSITAYLFVRQDPPDPRTGQPHGARRICGTARTNQFGDVDFVVHAEDNSEPGVNDVFILRVTQGGECRYTTEHDSNHTLGGSGPGGGNIQLHKPNPSTTGDFFGSCPALDTAC